MRLFSLEIAGFRGFASKQTFDLNADAVVVVGANGNGKTSLFDAVMWALSGRIPRLGGDNSQLLCKFVDSGQARVVLRLQGEQGSPPITVTRIFDGREMRVTVETPEGSAHGPEAEGRLIRLIWSEAAMAASPAEALATVLSRSVYLQQDLVREFIDAVTDQERFTAVSELVGAGRVTDLQAELEREKKAWSKATNSRAEELQPIRYRLATMVSRLAELKGRLVSSDDTFDDGLWNKWWGELQTFGVSVGSVSIDSREAASAIDAAIQQLDAARRAAERRQQLLDSLGSELTEITGKTKPDLASLRDTVAVHRRQLDATRKKVALEQARVAEVRRLQTELKEKTEQLQALAVLALKHLGEKCPICEQDYDMERTRRRLEAIAAGQSSGASFLSQPEALSELLAALSSHEKELAAAELAFRSAEHTAREFDATEHAIAQRLAQVGIEPGTSADRISAVREAARAARKQIERLERARNSGEAFALRLARIGDKATIGELQQEIQSARVKLQQDEKELAGRGATGEQAQSVIEALREAASRVVTERVKEIEPLLSEMYSRIDVHPAFRVVRFLASVVRGRGLLSTVVSDPLAGINCDAPSAVLSSSQMNALAVCMFLSLNLGITRQPLEAVIMDDPLQSLDDINLLGLVDLLRRTKDQRQLCISTHDVRFGNLLARKLRPRSPQQRTVVIELDGWSRNGPTVTTQDVRSDPVPLRLVASA
jgi:exonuclease SbcC